MTKERSFEQGPASRRRRRRPSPVVRLRSGGKMSLRNFERLKAEAAPRWLDDTFLESNVDIAGRLWNAGWGQGQIAEVLGPSSTTIREFLIEARSRGVRLRAYRGRIPGDPRVPWTGDSRRRGTDLLVELPAPSVPGDEDLGE